MENCEKNRHPGHVHHKSTNPGLKSAKILPEGGSSCTPTFPDNTPSCGLRSCRADTQPNGWDGPPSGHGRGTRSLTATPRPGAGGTVLGGQPSLPRGSTGAQREEMRRRRRGTPDGTTGPGGGGWPAQAENAWRNRKMNPSSSDGDVFDLKKIIKILK